jgi:hypothetical protein
LGLGFKEAYDGALMRLFFEYILAFIALYVFWWGGKRFWLIYEPWFRVFIDTRLPVIKREAERARKILHFPKRY